MQIRKHLIAASAPQKGSSIARRIQWARPSSQVILKSAREYAYGFTTYSRAGQIFHIPVAPIIDISTYELFVKMREENKTYEQHRGFVMKKQLVDELVVEAMIDGKRDIQVKFQAKIMDLAVSQ